jgi:hypothetical protein
LTASIPDKFLDSLPKSFLILVILGGFVIAFTSPIWLLIEQWLPTSHSLDETLSSIAIILSSSLIAGIPVILLETPIVGNNGLYSRIGNRIRKNHNTTETTNPTKDETGKNNPTKPDFSFMVKVDFYGWLNKNGCIKFLDQVNLQNTIVNALIVGFTISSILNIIGILFLVIFNPIMNLVSFNLNREIIIAALALSALVALVIYNRKWWNFERKETLTKIGEEYIEELKRKKIEAKFRTPEENNAAE